MRRVKFSFIGAALQGSKVFANKRKGIQKSPGPWRLLSSQTLSVAGSQLHRSKYYELACQNKVLLVQLLYRHWTSRGMTPRTAIWPNLKDDRHTFDKELVSCLSPCLIEHVNRLGRHTLRRVPEP